MEIILKLDLIFARILYSIIKSLTAFTIIFIGVVVFLLFFVEIFEYGEGWADVSLLEICFMVLTVVLLYRHYKYCKRFKVSWNHLLFKPFRNVGLLGIGALGFCGIFLTVNINKTMLDLIGTETVFDKVVGNIMFLLALYLSTPTKQTAITEIQSNKIKPEKDKEEKTVEA